MSVRMFLFKVYGWLYEPWNRSVEDLHYEWRRLQSKREFKKNIVQFLNQRREQMNLKRGRFFINCAANKYIRNMVR